MKHLLILIFILLSSCADKRITDTYQYTNNDSIYIRDHLNTITTPYNREVSFKVYNGYYKIYYTSDGITRSYPDSFKITNSYPRNYKIQDENSDYILLTGSCGNPCHISYLLPLKDGNAMRIADVIFSDLSKNYIVSVAGEDSLRVQNIRINQSMIINIDYCDSAYPGYCIDSMYFSNDTLIYRYSDFVLIKGERKVKLNI